MPEVAAVANRSSNLTELIANLRQITNVTTRGLAQRELLSAAEQISEHVHEQMAEVMDWVEDDPVWTAGQQRLGTVELRFPAF